MRQTILVAVLAAGTAVGCAGEIPSDELDGLIEASGGGGSDAGDGGALDGSVDVDMGVDDAGPVDPCPQFADVFNEFVVPTCASQFCHDSDNPSANLDMLSDGLAARLVDQPARDSSCTLIDSADPSNSLMRTILEPGPPCSIRMPLTGMGLDAAQIACMEVWIDDVIASQ